VLKPPGLWGENGADIVVGEGQPLGVPLSGGGPYFGFMCCTLSLVRQIPGRIVGQTVDQDQKRGFTLTLQAREQHIRRSKATSNICTNQGLAVTAATIYMSIMGAEGLEQVANQSMFNIRKLLEQLKPLHIVPSFESDFFHEVLLKLPVATDQFIQGMLTHGIDPGFKVSDYFETMPNSILVCLTETKTQANIDQYAAAAKQVIQTINGGQ